MASREWTVKQDNQQQILTIQDFPVSGIDEHPRTLSAGIPVPSHRGGKQFLAVIDFPVSGITEHWTTRSVDIRVSGCSGRNNTVEAVLFRCPELLGTRPPIPELYPYQGTREIFAFGSHRLSGVRNC